MPRNRGKIRPSGWARTKNPAKKLIDACNQDIIELKGGFPAHHSHLAFPGSSRPSCLTVVPTSRPYGLENRPDNPISRSFAYNSADAFSAPIHQGSRAEALDKCMAVFVICVVLSAAGIQLQRI